MILNTLIRLFGRPKNDYSNGTQYSFNCPKCALKNGGVSDGKHNLEVKLWNKNRAFSSQNIWHCWVCEEGGDLLYLLKRWGTKKQVDEYKEYAKEFGVTFKEDEETYVLKLPSEFIPFTKMDIKNPYHLEAYNYMVKVRNVSPAILAKYRIGFCLTGRYAKRIVFPSYDVNNELNFFTARTYVNDVLKYDNVKADRTKIIFNEYYINWNTTVYLTEGVFEVYAYDVNNIPLLSKVLSDKLLMMLVKYNPPVVVCLNPDARRSKKDNIQSKLNKRVKASSTMGICKQLKECGVTNVAFTKLVKNDLGEISQIRGKKHIFDIMVKNTEIYQNEDNIILNSNGISGY
jgi:hypothetical protein